MSTETKTQPKVYESAFCMEVLREADALTGIQFHDCRIDHTACPVRNCVRKLV